MADAKKKARQTKAFKPHKSCPKCGPGVHLGVHLKPVARLACGKCGYTEMTSAAPAKA